jgi:Zn-dependent protease
MVLSGLFVILYKFFNVNYYSIATEIFIYAIYINWGLFIFNLLPVPPLDGSHLLLAYFKKYPALYNGLYKYGSYLFLGVIILSLVSRINLLPIWPLVQFLANGYLSLLGFGS